MIFFHTKFRMLLDWTASRIQFHQTSLTNVAKFLLLQVFLNIRHKLFEFQTFMNQTQIIILQTLLYTLQTHIIYIIIFYETHRKMLPDTFFASQYFTRGAGESAELVVCGFSAVQETHACRLR